MKVKVTNMIMDHKAGEIIDLPDHEAITHIALKNCVKYEEPTPPPSYYETRSMTARKSPAKKTAKKSPRKYARRDMEAEGDDE